MVAGDRKDGDGRSPDLTSMFLMFLSVQMPSSGISQLAICLMTLEDLEGIIELIHNQPGHPGPKEVEPVNLQTQAATRLVSLSRRTPAESGHESSFGSRRGFHEILAEKDERMRKTPSRKPKAW
jgi:hypothetical protein